MKSKHIILYILVTFSFLVKAQNTNTLTHDKNWKLTKVSFQSQLLSNYVIPNNVNITEKSTLINSLKTTWQLPNKGEFIFDTNYSSVLSSDEPDEEIFLVGLYIKNNWTTGVVYLKSEIGGTTDFWNFLVRKKINLTKAPKAFIQLNIQPGLDYTIGRIGAPTFLEPQLAFNQKVNGQNITLALQQQLAGRIVDNKYTLDDHYWFSASVKLSHKKYPIYIQYQQFWKITGPTKNNTMLTIGAKFTLWQRK